MTKEPNEPASKKTIAHKAFLPILVSTIGACFATYIFEALPSSLYVSLAILTFIVAFFGELHSRMDRHDEELAAIRAALEVKSETSTQD